MRLLDRGEFAGTAELDGVRREVGLMLCPEAQVGDYLLVHAGYAISAIDEEEALETIELIKQATALEEEAMREERS